MPSPARKKDRRQLNAPTAQERRGKAADRRKCPECGSALKTKASRLAGGTVSVTTCSQCSWQVTQRQTDVDVLTLKLTWALGIEAHQGGLAAVIPSELIDALKAKAGDEMILSPLTSPVGSLAPKWALTLKRKKKA